MKYLVIVFCFLSTYAFTQESTQNNSKKHAFNCLIIQKPLILKNNVESEIMEYYLRSSGKDYFIKFCESKISEEVLAKYLGQHINVYVEVKDGLWDNCTDEMVQSRTGSYAVINGIRD